MMTNDEIVQQLRTLLQAVLADPSVPVIGSDLQAAIDNATYGDVLALAPESVYTGNFRLKAGLTLKCSVDVPAGRVVPGMRLPKIISPNSEPAFAFPTGANLRLIGLETFGDGGADLVTLGDGSSAQNMLSQVPSDIVIDRCYLHGSAANGQKRGIALNSSYTSIDHCHFADFKLRGQDSQAIAGWNGQGRYAITSNYIEGAGENIIFGGSDPAIPFVVAADITIRGNLFVKPPAWRSEGWQVKNLLEFKNARRVNVSGNTFDGCWPGFTQGGYAILLTPRNQDGGAPWVQVEQVDIENNIIRHCAGGFSILGVDDTHPSQRTTGIKILNNLLQDIDPVKWNGPNGELGTGRLFAILGGPDGVEIAHNTGQGANLNSWLTLGGDPATGLIIRDNVFDEGEYGLKIDGGGMGLPALLAHSPGSRLLANAVTNAIPTRFIDYGAGNSRSLDRAYPPATGSDGTPIGVDLSQLPA